MSNVIELRPKSDPHGSGHAFCLQCGHEWMAIAPVGETRFECPECHTHKGLWKFEFAPKVGDMVRECRCGNQLFYIKPEGHMCANCGTVQDYS